MALGFLAHGKRCHADERTIAIGNFRILENELEYQEVDHWINHTGLLSVAEIKSIARKFGEVKNGL